MRELRLGIERAHRFGWWVNGGDGDTARRSRRKVNQYINDWLADFNAHASRSDPHDRNVFAVLFREPDTDVYRAERELMGDHEHVWVRLAREGCTVVEIAAASGASVKEVGETVRAELRARRERAEALVAAA